MSRPRSGRRLPAQRRTLASAARRVRCRSLFSRMPQLSFRSHALAARCAGGRQRQERQVCAGKAARSSEGGCRRPGVSGGGLHVRHGRMPRQQWSKATREEKTPARPQAEWQEWGRRAQEAEEEEAKVAACRPWCQGESRAETARSPTRRR